MRSNKSVLRASRYEHFRAPFLNQTMISEGTFKRHKCRAPVVLRLKQAANGTFEMRPANSFVRACRPDHARTRLSALQSSLWLISLPRLHGSLERFALLWRHILERVFHLFASFVDARILRRSSSAPEARDSA